MDTQSKAHRLPISVIDQVDHVTKFWQHALCAVNFVGTAQSVWETFERPQKLIDGFFQESRAPSATFMLLLLFLRWWRGNPLSALINYSYTAALLSFTLLITTCPYTIIYD